MYEMLFFHTTLYFMYISNKMIRCRKMLLFLTVEYIARNLSLECGAIFISPRYLCAIEIRELWHV